MIGKKMPKKGRGASGKGLDPLSLPVELLTALDALYGHYEKTFDALAQTRASASRRSSSSSATTRRRRSSSTNTSPASMRENDDGTTTLENGRLALFRNFDDHGNPLSPAPTRS